MDVNFTRGTVVDIWDWGARPLIPIGTFEVVPTLKTGQVEPDDSLVPNRPEKWSHPKKNTQNPSFAFPLVSSTHLGAYRPPEPLSALGPREKLKVCPVVKSVPVRTNRVLTTKTYSE